LEIVDGQPPQVAPPQHQNPDAPSWHRELVLGAVDTAAADEAAPTFDNTEGQGDRCRLSGVAPGAAMRLPHNPTPRGSSSFWLGAASRLPIVLLAVSSDSSMGSTCSIRLRSGPAFVKPLATI
jgi:hypothetical protein